jgi:Zn-dependent protease
MTASLRLGRIAGIQIGASWSVLFIALLIAWSLAGGILPVQAPGLEPSAYWLGALVATGLFFGSLLAHELGHAVVARRAGLRVRGITLWLLGGVAQLGDEPESPRDDLRVAAVALGAVGAPTLATAVAAWLAVGNTALAVFNLIPAAPLDGGRVLRALLWRRHGNRTRAAVTATVAGQVAGFALIAFGLLGFLFGLGFGDLWIALVGWFLVGAARQERDYTVARQGLEGLRVGDIMRPTPPPAPAWFTVDAFLRVAAGRRAQRAAPAELRRPAGRRGDRGRARVGAARPAPCGARRRRRRAHVGGAGEPPRRAGHRAAGPPRRRQQDRGGGRPRRAGRGRHPRRAGPRRPAAGPARCAERHPAPVTAGTAPPAAGEGC